MTGGAAPYDQFDETIAPHTRAWQESWQTVVVAFWPHSACPSVHMGPVVLS